MKDPRRAGGWGEAMAEFQADVRNTRTTLERRQLRARLGSSLREPEAGSFLLQTGRLAAS